MYNYELNEIFSIFIVIPSFQLPVFISTFMAFREMANLPVESFKTGGLLWFKDLAVPDPYLALPLITCSTLFVIIKV